MRVSRGLAVCLAGSAGVLLSLWAACRHVQPDVDAEERAALVDAFGPARLVPGRLAGLPFAPPRRGGAWPKPQDEEAWRRAANEVEARLRDHRSPAALANQAFVKLALGEPLETASGFLEQAVAMPRPGARVWSDLAALYLAQAERTKEPHRLVAALRAADEAVRLDPRLPEALFNRAKVAERLSLRSRAQEDWQLYLKLDSGSPWAAEARTSLAILSEPTAAERWTKALPRLEKAVEAGDAPAVAAVAADFPDRARGYLEGTVFPAWAAAVEGGDAPQAAQRARAAHLLGSRLLDLTGDLLDAEAASAIGSVSPALALDLARAHRQYAEGVRLYDQSKYTLARPHFADALAGFDRARSPFSLAARSKVAACDYQTDQKGLAAAGEILAIARSHAYWGLVGGNDWMIGLAKLEGGQADRARPWLDEARTAFRKTREASSEASIDSLLANCLDHLGKGDEAWHAQLGALAAAARAGDPWPLTNIFSAAARILSERGQPAEAIHFQDEVLELVKTSGDMQRIAEADWGRAKISADAGDVASAKSFIAKAEDDCNRIPDQKAARPTRAGIAAEAGRIWLGTDPKRALGSFTSALDLYEHNAYSRTKILLARARANRVLGYDHDAERDLVTAVGEYEQQRGKVQPGPLQVAYFETAQQVFDELVAIELDRLGNPDQAFDYAERARARLLLDSLAARHLASARPLATAEVERGLPPGTVLVEYAVLPDRVVAWARGAGRAWRSIAWQKADLEAAVASLAKTIAVPSGDAAADRVEFERQSGVFFERLIAPILDQVPQGATLVVVPDGALRELPFAALHDARSSSFLIERNPLVVAPSATIFLAPSDHRAARPRDRWHSLAVGNPTIDLALYPDHGPLPKTEQEARDVAAAHPGSLLVQDDATVPAFLAVLDRFELIHFAGHAGVSAARPALLFTPATGRYRTGALDVEAIAAQRLTRPRLAVLAACSAAGGSSLGLEGGADLARSFLEAGVPAVVANLWSLGDEEASVFLGAFYRSFWQGRSATSALREAQLAMIHHPNARFHRPAVWGGFRLLGTAAGQGLH